MNRSRKIMLFASGIGILAVVFPFLHSRPLKAQDPPPSPITLGQTVDFVNTNLGPTWLKYTPGSTTPSTSDGLPAGSLIRSVTATVSGGPPQSSLAVTLVAQP